MKNTIYIVIMFMLFFSCKKENRWDFVKGTGKITTELRPTQNYNSIFVEDKINVFITQDSVSEIKVEAGSNLIGLIRTEFKDSILYIRNDNKGNFTRSYKKGTINIYLKVRALANIEQYGQGTIQSINTLTAPFIDIVTKGAGDVILTVDNKKISTHMHNTSDIYLSGRTHELSNYQIHYGYLYAQNLSSDISWNYHDGSGNAYVNVNSEMIAYMFSTGDIYYKGNPGSIIKKEVGTGRLIKQ